jgi:hypothetical protein
MREMLSDPKYGGSVVARSKYQPQAASEEDGSEGADSEQLSGGEDAEVSASGGSEGDEGSSDEDFDGDSGQEDGDDDEEQMEAGGSSAAAGLAADLDAELLALEQGDSQALIASARQTQDEAAQGVRVRQQLVRDAGEDHTGRELGTAILTVMPSAAVFGGAALPTLCGDARPVGGACHSQRQGAACARRADASV